MNPENNLHGFVLVAILLSSFVTGLFIFTLKEESRRLRTWLNLIGAGIKLILVAALLVGVYQGQSYSFTIPFLPGIPLSLGADANSVLFVTLSTVLWFVTTVYAVGYLEHSPHRSRFFGFFSLCVTATTGVALSANLMTFLVFYELLTVSTYPLVVHKSTREAIAGGRTYLSYTLAGGAVLLLAVAWLHSLAGTVVFKERGALQALAESHPVELRIIFFMFMAGLGVKAALVPLHGWLPRAMVAPAPVSALLHAVAVVKAGAFGIVRIIYDVYGAETAAALGVLWPLAWVAALTIVYGAAVAAFQDELKKRLAFSTVSQVSYVVLGAAILGPVSTIGGLIHLVHQGIMKITLFFCAGNFAEQLGVYKVSQMNGVGRRMPFTAAAFTLAAAAMIGVPFSAGAITKKYITAGANEAGAEWAVWVLWLGSLLSAAYFLPVLWRAWFKAPAVQTVSSADQVHVSGGSHMNRMDKLRHLAAGEASWMLLLPPVATVLLVLWAGLAADTSFSVVAWVKLIAAREFSD